MHHCFQQGILFECGQYMLLMIIENHNHNHHPYSYIIIIDRRQSKQMLMTFMYLCSHTIKLSFQLIIRIAYAALLFNIYYVINGELLVVFFKISHLNPKKLRTSVNFGPSIEKTIV